MPTPDTAVSIQKNVRKYIFEHFEEHATAPVLEQIMQKFVLDRISAFNGWSNSSPLDTSRYCPVRRES